MNGKHTVLDEIKRPQPAKPNRGKWTEENYVKCYRLAKEGKKKGFIAKSMGIGGGQLESWFEQYPALLKAYKDGKRQFEDSTSGKQTKFFEYVYRQLPGNVKKVWDEIMECTKMENAEERINFILDNNGKRMRQHIFVHAMVSSNFNMSTACQRTGTPLSTVHGWLASDSKFKELIDEIHFHKKNFFEGALVKLVKQGDVSATLFANRTLNKDRGYGDKTQVEITGNLHHKHENLINFEDLDLPAEILSVIYEKLKHKKSKESAVPALPYNTIEGKAVPVEEEPNVSSDKIPAT